MSNDEQGMTRSRAAYANARGPSYARWYMEQMRFPEVAAAWAGGYYREMRLYLTEKATRQVLDGLDQPRVEIPRELIAGWAATSDTAKARSKVTGSLSAALAELGASIRGEQRSAAE